MNTAAPITNIVADAKGQSTATAPYNPSPLHRPRPGVLAPKTLLMGAPGTGKTWSIVTLLQAGIEVFCIITEPNALPNLLQRIKQVNAPIDKFHYKYVPPLSASFSALSDMMQIVSIQSYSAIAELKAGIAKDKCLGMRDVLFSIQNFKDDRTGLTYGDATEWGYDRALVIDSLSGLNLLAQQLTVGLKPTMHQGEWNVAMNVEEMLINKLTSDMKAYLVVLAHTDRNSNETTQQMVITPAALGSKLGPKIGRFFSEVVMARRTGEKFTWSTLEPHAEVKQSALPIKSDLPPSFAPIVQQFENNLKQLGA